MFLCEALKPFAKSPHQQKMLNTIANFYRFKSLFETVEVHAEDDDNPSD